MEFQANLYPPVPVKQFMVREVEEHVDAIQETAEKIIKKFDTTEKKPNSKNFFQRHFIPVYFIDNSTRIGYFNHQANTSDQNHSNLFLRVVVGIIATVGVLLGADSLGEDTAQLLKYKGMGSHSKSIQGETIDTIDCTPKTKALAVSEKSKQLAGRVIKHTFYTSVAPKVTMVSGCVFSLLGALINLPIAIALGIGLGLAGLAGKLFSKKALAGEEEKIAKSATLLIESIQEFNFNKSEPTLPAYNPQCMIH